MNLIFTSLFNVLNIEGHVIYLRVVAINVNKSTQHKLTCRTKALSQWIEETKICAIRESMVQVCYLYLTYAKSPLCNFTLN